VAVRSLSTGAPVRATIVLAVLATVYAILGTFEQIAAFFMCTTLGFVALAAAGIFRLRGNPDSATTFRMPGYPVTPVLFVVLVLAVVAMVAINQPRQALAGLVIVLVGLPVSGMFLGTQPPATVPDGHRRVIS
jgi:basic amino acid/polyamine antiporter, APA family